MKISPGFTAFCLRIILSSALLLQDIKHTTGHVTFDDDSMGLSRKAIEVSPNRK